jgi:hypothetical protein
MELDRPDATAATVIREPQEPSYEPERGRGGGMGLAIAAAIALMVAAGAGLWWMSRQPPESVEPTSPAVATPAPATQAPLAAGVAPDTGLPALDESDELVARLALGLTSHPQLERWLGVGSFIRRLVVAVDNVAEGVSPRKHLPFLEPTTAFGAIEGADGLRMAPESMARYDLVAEVVASMDMQVAANLYGRLKPLFVEAWKDLGHPDGDFDRRLIRAIDRLLATPNPTDPPKLVAKVASYEYLDPTLEALSPAQKHLIRMGYANAEKIRGALTRLRAALTGG